MDKLGIPFDNVGRAILRISMGLSSLAILALIYDLGMEKSAAVEAVIEGIYLFTCAFAVLSLIFRYALSNNGLWQKARFFDAVFFLFIILILFNRFGWLNTPFFDHPLWIYFAVILVFIREFSTLQVIVHRSFLNPAQLFVISFLLIIFFGTLLLLLPKATHSGISFVDAFFTSTSAVCVTGLIVVDTGSHFTLFGQSVILFLIQAGGIGIMTFTSYFSYFFRGGSSYESQLMLKNLTNAEKISDVFSTLRRIIFLTFAIEAFGAFFIFLSLGGEAFKATSESLFFSVFHAISAFCNAGFSTLPDSLYESGFRFNYPLHLVVAGLFIVGGLGFPIVFNFLRYFKHIAFSRIVRRKSIHLPWLINLNTRLALVTTASLLISGTVLLYLFEYRNTLADHQGAGKLVAAFFGAATTRTAGFNSVDTSAMSLPSLMIVFLLMWIGASPGSTGGGIKTTTFAVGTLNFISMARGKDRLEAFRREISPLSVHRAFAAISLSLIALGFSVFLISIFDSGKDLLAIAFECFSAYSTVGLSLGITAELSLQSKWVIILTMFIGRVSMLTILTALLRKMKYLKYKYPSEDILIN